MTYSPSIIIKANRLFARKRDGFGWRNSPEAARSVYGPLRDGRITLSMTRLPLAACEAGMAMLGNGCRTESGEHMAMKRAAVVWMSANGGADAAEEVSGYSGRFDAYSISADWIVECGNTNIGKLEHAIADEDHPRFTLIPWQPVQWPDGSPRRLIAVDFTWDDSLIREVLADRMERQGAFHQRYARARRERLIAERQAILAASAPSPAQDIR